MFWRDLFAASAVIAILAVVGMIQAAIGATIMAVVMIVAGHGVEVIKNKFTAAASAAKGDKNES